MAGVGTLEINKIMYNHPITRKYYRGTWALDKVPMKQAFKRKARSCFIVNSCPSTHPGSHWTSVWIDENKNSKKRKVEHFCSYGLPPPLKLHRLLSRGSTDYKRNRKHLQKQNSILCGYYCMIYLMFKCRGLGMKAFLKCFTDYPEINDRILKLVW